LIAGAIALAQGCLVAWQWANGGIGSHHLLANPELPAISNGWGMLALPAPAWILTGRFLRRATSPEANRSIWFAAVGAMGAGALLSLAFTYGSVDHATLVMLLILLSGALLPLYRAEYLLGFVLAMNWVFGPILPMVGAVHLKGDRHLCRSARMPGRDASSRVSPNAAKQARTECNGDLTSAMSRLPTRVKTQNQCR
jgi:hypothetical protein